MKSKKVVLRIVSCIVLACLIFVGAMAYYIHRNVQEYTEIAQKFHPNPGDDSMALVQFMNSESHSLQERNQIIWTIGRLASPDALPFLESAYTGGPCDHEKYICQYELEKAIRRCGGSVEALQNGSD
jgi:hypothetical protein